MRIAISTGGGDAPGLNAVIRAVVVAAVGRGWDVLGVGRGFGGLLGEDEIVPLDRRSVRGLTPVGGTILGTTNRGNPFAWPVRAADGSVTAVDRSDEVLRAFRRNELDALVLVGGDGTLRIGYDFWQKGMPVVGVPKTIDNDVGGTVMSFGFDTAVTTATDALDKIHSTAASHDRVLVVEVMGRHAGWIALHSGLAGSAHVILIPEIPYDIERVCAAIREREARGRHFSIVVVAEGAAPRGGTVTLRAAGGAGTSERLGGVAEHVAAAIAERTAKETRTVTLGHLQRGGSPTTFDRLLGLRFGAAAIRAVAAGAFGQMVVLEPPTVTTAPLERAAAGPRTVPLDGDTLLTARELGVALGI